MLNWTLRLWHQWNSVLISISFWCDQETMFCSSETSKKCYQKNLKKFNFMSFDRSRITFDQSNVLFQLIEWWSSQLWDFVMKFFNFLIDREFPLIYWTFLFDRSNRNRESIESSRNFEMNLLNVSIDQKIPLINRMNCFLNFH